MKKTILAMAMVVALGFTGYQLADARPGAGYGPGGYGLVAAQGTLDEETLQAREAFYEATRELRRTMQTKQAQLQAAINAGDESRAQALSEEVFDLRSQMHDQAREAGIARSGRFGTCGGPALGIGGRGGRGAGPRS
ncbi:hypothetical protein [Desulfurivibrio dismutans]|uniref:hypothetical protein n=1 Tax=Desulfurivibrio dismutans TaxID=1398908 RepID=UPI0023DCC516|nr:hypothetical protein [Desulfurivibrio alkaliphilus]MDF1614279.1 hypothetical protein [Desulfurivibrio alkaliphilus]